MENYIVYKHTNLLNGKIYIGITKHGDNPEIRWQHGQGYVGNKEFFNDILFYGWSNFSHIILEKNLTKAEALRKETEYILLYDSILNGYNKVAKSGNGPSESGCEKISEALKGIKRSQISITKQMDTKHQRYGSGRGIHYLGSNIKRVRCIETGDVFASAAEAGRWSKTSKISECCNGKRQHAGRHPETNILLSWEYVNNNCEITKICEEDYIPKQHFKIMCISTNKIYNSAAEASRDTGISLCNILRVCNGERKTAGGLQWTYIKEEK